MFKWILILFFLFFSCNGFSQQVGIGTNTPHPSALVDVTSTAQGFLPPRLTLQQRNAITNPPIGLTIWCSDCNEMQIYSGYMWTNLSGSAASLKSVPSIKICYHNWMYENLNIRTYRNGDTIPVVTDPVQWTNLTTGAMCWYNNDSTANSSTYGALYNWYALNDARGLAPEGWRLPSNNEWAILASCLNGDSVAGAKIKAVSPLWAVPNTGATNASGFSALPSGYRNNNGAFSTISQGGYWWSITENNPTTAWYRFASSSNLQLPSLNALKGYGFSVRCIKY